MSTFDSDFREWFLEQISGIGEDAASDYNDGEDVLGWFGFSISNDYPPKLHATYIATDDEGNHVPAVEYMWELREVNG